MSEKRYCVWTCKIAIAETELPNGFDGPPRMAAQKAIEDAGFEVLMNSSGWGGKLTATDREYLAGNNSPQDVYFAGLMDEQEGGEQ